MATVNGKHVTVVSTGAFSVTCRGPRGGRVVLLKCKVNGVWMVSQNGKAEKLISHSGFDLPQETTEEKVKRLFPLAEIRAIANGFQKPGYVVELPGRTLEEWYSIQAQQALHLAGAIMLLKRFAQHELPEHEDANEDNVTLVMGHIDHEHYRHSVRLAKEFLTSEVNAVR